MTDLIDRQAAIEALDKQIEQCNKALSSFDISAKDEYAVKVERASLKAYKEQLENLPPVQPTLMRSIGKLVGYTGEPCPYCGRLRVERYESGLEICEKCNWCEQTKSFWLDGVF